MNDIVQTNEKLEIDKKKLDRMKLRVLHVEWNNILTNAKTDTQMIDLIKQIIIEEAKKCYWSQ